LRILSLVSVCANGIGGPTHHPLRGIPVAMTSRRGVVPGPLDPETRTQRFLPRT
jgi:hypothetical protein